MTLPWNRSDLLDVWTWPQMFFVNLFCWWSHDDARRRCVRALACLSTLTFTVSLTTSAALSIGSGSLNTFLLFTLGPTYLGAFKIMAIIDHGDRLKECMAILDDLLMQANFKIDSKLRALIRRQLFRNWAIFLSLIAQGCLVTVTWLGVPILLSLTTDKKVFMAETWPVFDSDWWQYAAVYIFQSISVAHFGAAIYIFPSLYFSIAEGILIQFRVLEFHLKQIQESTDSVEKSLRSCSILHSQILKVCYLLRNSSKGVIFFQTTLVSVTACFGVFEVIYDKEANQNLLVNVSEVLVLHLFLTFVYCWYSSEISHQGKEVITALYAAGWEDWSVADKKHLLIVASFAQKPLVFGGIVRIELNTFINVIKTAFTYYNFIEAINLKK